MKKHRILLYIFSAMLFVFVALFCVYQAKKEDVIPFSVKVSSNGKTEEINCWKNEKDEYYVFLPSYANLEETTIYLDTEISFYIDGSQVFDGMLCDAFELGIPYDLTYSMWGKEYRHGITFMQSGGVATMYINTQSGSMEYIHEKKGNEEPGTLSLYSADGNLNYTGDFESLNGRGNSTWSWYDKKPYSLKLNDSVDLLGMGQAQKWILLANGDDSSNLRNKIVYDFADAVGLSYSPDVNWVDLYLNGEYVGLYLLSERNEVHPERVNIAEKDSFLVSLELEERLIQQKYPYVSTTSNHALRIHYPSIISNESMGFIERTLQSVENAILAEDGIDPVTGKSWLEWIDLDSWARKYLIEEIFGNYDAGNVSQYFYYDGNKGVDKIFAGPVWDFDHSLGNEATWQLRDPNSFYANNIRVEGQNSMPWFARLYQKEEFYNRVVELYQTEFYPLLLDLVNSGLSNYVAQLSEAAPLNQIRWFEPEDDLFIESNYIAEYISARGVFLNDIWSNGAEYYWVRAESEVGLACYAYYAVRPGERLMDLPRLEDTEYAIFKGWYYVDTDEPFDITAPINEDIAIYAKWQEQKSFWDSAGFKLLPIGVIAVIFLCLLAIEIKRIKGGSKNVRKKSS